jgi:hypothetical protein
MCYDAHAVTAGRKTMKTATDDPFITQPERVAEIAQRAFGDAKDAALAENERLGIRSYGTVTDPRAARARRTNGKLSKPADHAAK